MPNCTNCKATLTQDNSYKKDSKRLNSRCKQCFNSYCISRWINRKIQAIQKLGDKCYDCKNSFPYPAYDFHHLDPKEKDMDWSKMRLISDKKLQSELSKCVLLCAVCHRLRHHNIALSN